MSSSSSTPNISYVSYFSGIGAAEYILQNMYKDATCLGFSEIDPHAINAYKRNFPSHENLGDITEVPMKTIEDIAKQKPTFIIGGFPCKQTSGLAKFRSKQIGIKGKQTGLLKVLVSHLQVYLKYNPKVRIVLENTSTTKILQKQITRLLYSKLKVRFYVALIDSHRDLGYLQRRRRLFFTNYPLESPTLSTTQSTTQPKQQWTDVLEPFDSVKHLAVSDRCINGLNKVMASEPSRDGTTTFASKTRKKGPGWILEKRKSAYKSRWEYVPQYSDTFKPYASTLSTSSKSTMLIDARNPRYLLIRRYTKRELCRLFKFPDNWLPEDMGIFRATMLFGNSIHTEALRYVLNQAFVK